ncbi:hypothetical protein [Nocardioides sp.]|uniref:hypothetical protein n=1 Tax=Nocardioides sp. TaxID=35761 RepID=UPI003784A901
MRKVAAALFLAWMLLLPATAHAQTQHTPDPAGDGLKGRALDITDVKLANRHRALEATISVLRVAHGDLGLLLQERHGGQARTVAAVLSYHLASGDRNRFLGLPHRRRCGGLVVRWDADHHRIRISIPSRCLRHGGYGALRARVITEIGSDADLAPNRPDGSWTWTRWVRRA